MKILAQYNPNSGGSYHRVKLWSEFVENVTLTEEVTEEQVSDCDILYIHWSSITSVPQLSIWREKYRFKVVADIDDTWDLETKFARSVFVSQHLCLFADHVICSTDYLVDQLKEFNPNVTVIPNLIPFGHGQFTPRTKQHKKLRVGIGGSISHLEDYLSLKGTIKYLEKQQWFRDNCEFAIIGYYAKDPRWQKVASMFKNVKLFGQKSPEEYMSLYDELDVMLLPLLDTPMNRGRSNLKIWECICKNVIPIASNNYSLGDELCVLKEPYQNRLKLIVENPNIGHWVAGRKDYGIMCVSPRLDLFKELSHHTFTPPEKYNLFSITYKDGQDVEYTEYRNKINSVEEKSYLFEYNPILDIIDNHFLDNRKYTGIFSHRFPLKSGYYKKYVEQILDEEDVDVIVFCKQIPNYIQWSAKQHPGLGNVLQTILDKLGIELTKEPTVTVYSNFFVAKTEVYREYAKFLKSAIYLMEHDPEIKGLVSMDAQYHSGLSKEDLKLYTGLDYYTFHTFVLERLMSIWIDHKGLTYSIHE
jgi:hypothetical protein